jgi:ribosome recycling factor
MTAIFLDSIGGLLALIAIVALVVVLQEYRKRRRRAALVKVAEKIGSDTKATVGAVRRKALRLRHRCSTEGTRVNSETS